MKSLSESLFDKDLASKDVPMSTRDSVKAVCDRLSKVFNVKPFDINDNVDVKEEGVGIIYRTLKSGNAGNVQFVTKIADRVSKSSVGSMGIGLSLEFYISSYNSDTADLCRVDVGWAYYYETMGLSSINNYILWSDESSRSMPKLKSFSFDSSNIDVLLNYISDLCSKLYNISKRDKKKILELADDYAKKPKYIDSIKAELSRS